MATVTNPDAGASAPAFLRWPRRLHRWLRRRGRRARRLIGESVARVDEERVERGRGHLAPQALAEARCERGMPGLGCAALRRGGPRWHGGQPPGLPLLPRASHRTRSTCRSGGAGGRVCDPTTTVCRPARLRSHRVPALVPDGVPPCHVHRCLLHPLPCLHLMVCVHRHLTLLGWFHTCLPRDVWHTVTTSDHLTSEHWYNAVSHPFLQRSISCPSPPQEEENE